MRGFLLTNIAVGKETEFFSALGAVHQILQVYYLFDGYDYLLEVEDPSREELTRLMTKFIRHLPGVERTAAFIETNPGAFAPMTRESASEVAVAPH